MITNVDHIGIAVRDIEAAKALYRKLFKVVDFHEEVVEDQGVHVASFQLGEVRIELTAPTNDESPIAKFIGKRGEGIHHIAFKSDSIKNDLDALASNDISLINSTPQPGAHDMLIAFLHPKSTGGVLMELCTEK